MHILIKSMALSRANYLGRLRGKELMDHEVSQIIHSYRRRISVAASNANANCLFARLSQRGEGAREAATRRHSMMARDEASRRDKEAHFMANIRGRGDKRLGSLESNPPR